MSAIDGGERPRYQVIADELRLRIRRRELPPGAQVPTEKELADAYQCSRNTVRMALNTLANEGLITAGRARAGRNVRRSEKFVLTHRVEDAPGATRLRGPDGFVDQAHRQGRAPGQTIEVAFLPADAALATLLEVPAGERLVLRRRVRSLDEAPSHLSESYYPFALVRGTLIVEPEEIVPSVVPLLSALGHRQIRFVDEIVARMPDPDEGKALDLGPGVPVLEHTRIGHSVERPVRVTRTILPADRHELRYEIPG